MPVAAPPRISVARILTRNRIRSAAAVTAFDIVMESGVALPRREAKRASRIIIARNPEQSFRSRHATIPVFENSHCNPFHCAVYEFFVVYVLGRRGESRQG